MAITVSFTGSPQELIELITSNGFLTVMRNKLQKEDGIEVRGANVPPSESEGELARQQAEHVEQKKSTVTRALMTQAVQEYAVRMHNRYRGNCQMDARAMCVELLKEVSGGEADHTSRVPENKLCAVYEAARADYIPKMFQNVMEVK